VQVSGLDQKTINEQLLSAELLMHEERVERHCQGVQQTLNQTDTDYRTMLDTFAQLLEKYRDEIFALEKLFVNATTTGRLLSLQGGLTKRRDAFMEKIRLALRNFRKRFDDAMQYLREANMTFRKSFK
jgi:signal transduction protein with GAF and PtsI domain